MKRTAPLLVAALFLIGRAASAPVLPVLIPVALPAFGNLLAGVGLLAGGGLVASQLGAQPVYRSGYRGGSTYSRYPSSPPRIPECEFGALRNALTEAAKELPVLTVEAYLGNRTDIDALRIRNVMCLAEGADKIKVLSELNKFVASCFGRAGLAANDEKMLRKVRSFVNGEGVATAKKVCVAANAVRYETSYDDDEFDKLVSAYDKLCEVICDL